AQDIIAMRLASALDVELVRADSRRAAIAGTSLDAEDLAMRCQAAAIRLSADLDVQARGWCEQALQMDPNNVRALVQLAAWHATRVSRVQSADPVSDAAQARALVTRALAVAPDDYAVRCAEAAVLEDEHRLRDSIAAAERCSQLNPSHIGAYKVLAIDHFFLGEPYKTLEYVQRGMRMSPRDPNMPLLLLFKGWAYFQLHQDEEALLWLRQATASAPENPTALAALASLLALTGRDAEAHAAMTRYLDSKEASTRTIAQWSHVPDDNAAFREFGTRFKSGLRMAGMPER
ncbi:MAG: hypothetical protein ABI564_10860, partial [Ideonella sp.]